MQNENLASRPEQLLSRAEAAIGGRLIHGAVNGAAIVLWQ